MFTRYVPSTLVVLPLLLLSACREEEDLRTFKEEGTWTLKGFALDGVEFFEVDQDAREDAFMLQFNRDDGVVAAATCAAAGSDNYSVKGSTCRLGTPEWRCRCFSYVHERPHLMEWQEFAAGDAPPDVVSETGEDGEPGETEGDPSDSMAVDNDSEVNGQVLFQALPYTTTVYSDGGVFDSDGTTSRHVFQQKAPTIFVETECAQTCGI